MALLLTPGSFLSLEAGQAQTFKPMGCSPTTLYIPLLHCGRTQQNVSSSYTLTFNKMPLGKFISFEVLILLCTHWGWWYLPLSELSGSLPMVSNI